MTKNLAVKDIDKNTRFMRMSFEKGRAAKAAQLHAVSDRVESKPEIAWKVIQDKANDQKGGDRWKTRGIEGTWHRLHVTPRKSLFTPYKVAKGPGQGLKLTQTRFTRGITQSGQAFEFHDDWTVPMNSHRVMEESWVGSTVFVERDTTTLAEFQQGRSTVAHIKEGSNSISRILWSDLTE